MPWPHDSICSLQKWWITAIRAGSKTHSAALCQNHCFQTRTVLLSCIEDCWLLVSTGSFKENYLSGISIYLLRMLCDHITTSFWGSQRMEVCKNVWFSIKAVEFKINWIVVLGTTDGIYKVFLFIFFVGGDRWWFFFFFFSCRIRDRVTA